MKIKVAVIDDHVVVRAGLKYVIASEGDFEFVGEHDGGVGAADFVKSCGADVTLLDVRMPDRSGVDALRDIMAADPDARVVMLTTSDAEEDVFRSIDEGAKGYVMKESPIETIVEAVRTAYDGGIFMTDEVKRIYLARKNAKGLSPRESEVLELVAKGMNNREIAGILGISENSVKMHLKRIYFKLEVGDRVEAVTAAIARGIISG